jgi:hypothetical protein
MGTNDTGACPASVSEKGRPRHWLFRRARKLVVAVVGLTLLGIGIVMLVTPGPALVVIPLGLALLATEFIWAGRCLKRVRRLVARNQNESP